MKIVIAPDSFKENLTSLEVASSIERGILRVMPDANCIKIPVADGGEGTVQSLVDATKGKIYTKKVIAPLGDEVEAHYGMLGDRETAVIEMAEASGLHLVPKTKRNPLELSSYGTGQLIKAAIDRGARKIIIGLGGSATVDGGAGMAQALGVSFINEDDKTIDQPITGALLARIQDIDTTSILPEIEDIAFIIASDVTNPLCGDDGAAAVFGPQKGATPEGVKELDANLEHYANTIKTVLKKDVSTIQGAGAAGGLGAGLVAFTSAEMKRGIDLIIEITNLEAHLKDADIVITGEGRIDFQTAFGKTPAGVAKAAKRYEVPCIAIGGALADDASGVFEHGIAGLDSAVARPMDLDEALASSQTYLENAAERVMRMLMIGLRMAGKQ